ncbi:MAG TPA: hypothetical protein V6D33_11695 [Cyanophyceae cyanobacterium]
MQLTAKKFVSVAIINDLKEAYGDRFELLSSQSRSVLLVCFSQFRLLRQMQVSGSSWLLMRESVNSVPIVCWLGQEELQARVMECCCLDDSAIAHLIQSLAENL